MHPTHRWGFIGLGKIANHLAEALRHTTRGQLYAVASRSAAKATAFAERHGATRAYGSYEALLADPAVDVVYIATPHVFHCEWTLKALAAGKPVLCEKAFGMDETEVQTMVKAARTSGQFLMEALWTRFIPSTRHLLARVQAGDIGRVHHIRADFGFRAEYDPEARLFNPALGGGALLDIGIYPVFLSQLLLGEPQTVAAHATFAPTGVDSSVTMHFEYADDQTAILDCSFLAHTPIEAWIHGAEGTLRLPYRFHHAPAVDHYLGKGAWGTTTPLPYPGNGYQYELEEVMDCLDAGRTESPLWSLDDSLALIRTLDRVRDAIGLRYPQ